MNDKTIFSTEEIARRLSDRVLLSVSQNSGISYPNVLRLSRNEDHNYTMKTLERISEYLAANP